MFYVNVVHGRVIVTDLEESRREHEEKMERYYSDENERRLREASRGAPQSWFVDDRGSR